MLSTFLDTNILLDSALKRQPWFSASDSILENSRYAENMRAFVAATSLKDVYYIAAKTKGEPYARKAIRMFMESCEVVGISQATCEQALCGPEPDFEDGLIVAAARASHADLIISRDQDAFNACGIPKVDPILFAAFFLEDNLYPHAESQDWATVSFGLD